MVWPYEMLSAYEYIICRPAAIYGTTTGLVTSLALYFYSSLIIKTSSFTFFRCSLRSTIIVMAQDAYDSALLGILSNEGQIAKFLDVVMGFLYRR